MVLFRTVTGIVPALVLFDIKLPDELRNAVYSTAGTVVSAALILLYTVISAVMGKKKSDGFALGMGVSLFLGLLLLPLVWWPELLLSLAITGADGGLVVPLIVLSAVPIFVYILFRKYCSENVLQKQKHKNRPAKRFAGFFLGCSDV